MRIQVFANTPAHAHVYKHAVAELREGGHEVQVLARDYGCTHDILDYNDISYASYGYCGTTPLSLARNLPGHYVRIARATRRFDPDVIFGMGSYAAHAGLLSRTPVVLLLDSEPTSLDHAISRPFARAILTPRAFRKDLGENHYVFEGFKESAYLAPSVFEPDPRAREQLGVAEDERFVLLRFNAFGSHHDLGKAGFSRDQRRALIRELAEHATVFVSDEKGDMDLSDLPARPYDLHPALLHDVLAAADLLVADTQTMVTEAALVGTPAVRSNAFVGDDDMGNFVELESAGLVYNVAEFEAVRERSVELLSDAAAIAGWHERHAAYVADMPDLSEVIVATALAEGNAEAVAGLDRRDGSHSPPTTSPSAEPTPGGST
jgi:predicted glycosyltransferase